MLGLKELKKEYFPHLFNRLENQNYRGRLPSINIYGFRQMKRKDKDDALNWYRTILPKRCYRHERDHNELVKYSKTSLLDRQNEFITWYNGKEATTPLNSRDAFYDGRTNATKLLVGKDNISWLLSGVQ
jgi:hypothetical protein